MRGALIAESSLKIGTSIKPLIPQGKPIRETPEKDMGGWRDYGRTEFDTDHDGRTDVTVGYLFGKPRFLEVQRENGDSVRYWATRSGTIDWEQRFQDSVPLKQGRRFLTFIDRDRDGKVDRVATGIFSRCEEKYVTGKAAEKVAKTVADWDFDFKV